MNTAKHTPGPWIVRDFDGSIGTVETNSGIAVAQAQGIYPMTPQNHYIREANARLIAAAPELLEALERIAGFTLSQFMGPHDMALECVLTAKAAITKATGGEA